MKQRKRLTESYVRSFAIDLLRAVQFIHEKGVAHRDIKPDNILIKNGDTETPTVKLVDFGVSKRFLFIAPGKVGTVVNTMWTRTGNMYYCAPEVFKGVGYNAALDIWAIGVVIYQSLTGRLPFCENGEEDTINAIRSDRGEHFMIEDFKSLNKVC